MKVQAFLPLNDVKIFAKMHNYSDKHHKSFQLTDISLNQDILILHPYHNTYTKVLD